jgi:hypothetical protein
MHAPQVRFLNLRSSYGFSGRLWRRLYAEFYLAPDFSWTKTRIQLRVGGHPMPFIQSLRSVFLFVSVFALVSAGSANLALQQNRQPVKSALRKIYDEDQQNLSNEVRGALRAKVLQLVAENKVQTGEDYYFAAFVFQHGLKPEDYLYAHVLAVTALGKGFAPAKWLSAATLDRYLRSVKQPQIFGTQFGSLFDDGDLDPYNKELISDKLRELWCVVPYAKQLKIFEDSKSGKELTSTRICPIPD